MYTSALIRVQTWMRISVLRLRCSTDNWYDFCDDTLFQSVGISPKSVQNSWNEDHRQYHNQVGFVYGLRAQTKSSHFSSPNHLRLTEFQKDSKSQETLVPSHMVSPEIRSDFHSSPLLLSWFQKRGWVEGNLAWTTHEQWATLLCNFMSYFTHAFQEESDSFFEDQSVREIDHLLETSLWFSFAHFSFHYWFSLSSSATLRTYSFLAFKERDFEKAAIYKYVQAIRDVAAFRPNKPSSWAQAPSLSGWRDQRFPSINLFHYWLQICLRSKYALKLKQDKKLEWEANETSEDILNVKTNHWILKWLYLICSKICLEKNGWAGWGPNIGKTQKEYSDGCAQIITAGEHSRSWAPLS